MSAETGPAVEIRPMEKRDVDRVYEIECTCFRTPWSRHSLAGELKNSVAHYYVLTVDGTVYGYGGMWVLFDEAHVTNIAVMPEMRRNGYATKLLLSMMRSADALGAAAMTLEVRERNYAAQDLYGKLDFVQNGFRPRYYTDTGEGALLLWNTNIRQTVANSVKK